MAPTSMFSRIRVFQTLTLIHEWVEGKNEPHLSNKAEDWSTIYQSRDQIIVCVLDGGLIEEPISVAVFYGKDDHSSVSRLRVSHENQATEA